MRNAVARGKGYFPPPLTETELVDARFAMRELVTEDEWREIFD